MPMSRNGRLFSTGSNTVGESLKAEEAETVTPPPTEKVS
jgi:hypothetical protein